MGTLRRFIHRMNLRIWLLWSLGAYIIFVIMTTVLVLPSSTRERDTHSVSSVSVPKQIALASPSTEASHPILQNVTYHEWDDESMVQNGNGAKCNQKLSPQLSLLKLLLMTSNQELWKWIENRTSGMWDEWMIAGRRLAEDDVLSGHDTKRVLVLPGVLTMTNFARRRTIQKGGPLGELLQWADLIAGLYVLGHNVTLEHNVKVAAKRLSRIIKNVDESSKCVEDYDVIYVDLAALSTLPRNVKLAYRCRFRVIDVYGTQAMYNDPVYMEKNGIRNHNAGHLLHLKQYYTFYPQTPDNSFLGFVVTGKTEPQKKENVSVLYGKDATYTKNKESLINLLTEYTEVHYTMSRPLRISVRGTLIREGVLSSLQYGKLLDRAKVVVGLGHPIEGTGAMEALAHGCVFINPKYTGDAQQVFSKGPKPTRRLVTSQIPYLEQYIGPPHVYTVDIANVTELTSAIQQAINQSHASFIPEEFTMRGYLHRLAEFVQHQDFCTRHSVSTWPSLLALQTVIGDRGRDCSDTCYDRGMVCEQMYFPHVNTPNYVTRLKISCTVLTSASDIIYPALDSTPGHCVLQGTAHLYSCAGHRNEVHRICPCRCYRKYQVALPV